jgi:hypothetical protein
VGLVEAVSSQSMNVIRDKMSLMATLLASSSLYPAALTMVSLCLLACDPTQFDTPKEILRVARCLAAKYARGLAWSRDTRTDIDAYGAPTILFQSGTVPEME